MLLVVVLAPRLASGQPTPCPDRSWSPEDITIGIMIIISSVVYLLLYYNWYYNIIISISIISIMYIYIYMYIYYNPRICLLVL